MALLNGNKTSFFTGFVSGFGTGFTAREVLPAFRDVARPLFKSTVKSGILAFERTREATAEFGESVQDLFAEVRSEVEAEQGHRTAAGTHGEDAKQSQE